MRVDYPTVSEPATPEYVLEVLRDPLQSGHVHIARASRRVSYPARFQLVAAMNPCPCGYQGDASGRCRCTPDQVARYRWAPPKLDLQVIKVAA